MKQIALVALIVMMFAAVGCAQDLAGLVVEDDISLETGAIKPYNIEVQMQDVKQQARELVDHKNKLLAGIKIIDEKLLRLEGAFEILTDMKATIGEAQEPRIIEEVAPEKGEEQ